MKTMAGRLAEWIYHSQPDMIPSTVFDKAKISIFDTIGVTIAGAEDPVGQIITRYIQNSGGTPVSSLLGSSHQTIPSLAALGNGVMGHALDFDDTSYSYIGHPSVSVLPATLAIGEMVDASGLQILSAYILGTEVACKVGLMASPQLYEDGWHLTCVIGAFGAAAAAGKLLDLNEEQLVHALAITVSEVSGVIGNVGTMSKPFQVGRSAENGVVAALLAQQGMTGAPDIFEKPAGFCATYKVKKGFDPFYAMLGNPFAIEAPGFFLKEFPSCSATHAALSATNRLIREQAIDPAEVETVDCAATPLVVSSLSYPTPQNAVHARFSMQFCLATALLGRGEVKVTDFRDKFIQEPRVQRMMQKIRLRTSPEMAKKGFAPSDGPEAATVEITMKTGKRFHTTNLFADWRPDNMPSWEVLKTKYEDCTSRILSLNQINRSLRLIRRLEQLKSIHALIDTIRV